MLRCIPLVVVALSAVVLAAAEPEKIPAPKPKATPTLEMVGVAEKIPAPKPKSQPTLEIVRGPERIAAPAPRFQPRLEAVAETKLLMEGIHQANYSGLEKLLQQKPADEETWKFARGQALLIAESGNLLMLRPPKTADGQEPWMRHATDLREKAAALATATGSRDYERSKAALIDLAQSCNRCHQTFRVPTRIGPETRPGVRDAE